MLLNFCRPCKKTTKSRDKISSNMGKPIGFTNPIVSQDEYQGWKKVVVARGDGCKQRTDPYLFTPDKTKLRYRFSFVIPIKNYIHVSCAQCLISNPASFKFSMLPFSHTKHYNAHVSTLPNLLELSYSRSNSNVIPRILHTHP